MSRASVRAPDRSSRRYLYVPYTHHTTRSLERKEVVAEELDIRHT